MEEKAETKAESGAARISYGSGPGRGLWRCLLGKGMSAVLGLFLRARCVFLGQMLLTLLLWQAGNHALGLQPHCKQMSTFELFLPAHSGWIWHPAAWRGLIPGPSLHQGSPSPGFPSHSHLAIIHQQFVTLLVTILKLCKPQKALHEVSVFITYRPLALNAFCSC